MLHGRARQCLMRRAVAGCAAGPALPPQVRFSSSSTDSFAAFGKGDAPPPGPSLSFPVSRSHRRPSSSSSPPSRRSRPSAGRGGAAGMHQPRRQRDSSTASVAATAPRGAGVGPAPFPAEAAENLAALSRSFFADEAAAMGLSDGALSNLVEGTAPSTTTTGEGEGLPGVSSLPQAEHAPSLLDFMMDDGDGSGAMVVAASTGALAGSSARAMLPSNASASVHPLLRPVQDDPASLSTSLCALMTLGTSLPNSGDGAAVVDEPEWASAQETVAATELLLRGLDAKAVLQNNALEHMALRGKCLAQSDFSFTTWEDVEVVGCDLSQCLFYKGVMRGRCTFRRCRFDGSILTGLSILPTAGDNRGSATRMDKAPNLSPAAGGVVFIDCSFRRCAMGVTYASQPAPSPHGAGEEAQMQKHQRQHMGGGRTAGAVFVHCDFDLCSFERCVGLERHPEAFVRCVNTETAAKFPLRARSS